MALNVYLVLYTPITLLTERWERVAAERVLSRDEAQAMIDEYNTLFVAKFLAEQRLGEIPHADFERVDVEVSRAMRRFYDVSGAILDKQPPADRDDLKQRRVERDAAREQAARYLAEGAG